MSANRTLLFAGCAAAAAVVGWMAWTAGSVPDDPEPVARHTPPAGFVPAGGKAAAASGGQKPPAVAAPAEAPQLPAVPQKDLSLLYIVKCSACHGRDGKGPVGPSIAGKSFEENMEALKKYKAGQVENTLMADLLTRTDDRDLEMLAREVSSFR